MKNVILLITAITVLQSLCFSQSIYPTAKIGNPDGSNQYLIKAKNYKTAALVCLTGGAALATIGILTSAPKVVTEFADIFNPVKPPQQDYTSQTVLLFAGAIGIVASIPLFVSAGNNKRKATLLITNQKTALGLPTFVSKKITGLTLSVSL